MSYRYVIDGYSGGYPLNEIPEPEDVICELCGEACHDFKVENITASLSIVVCLGCYNQEPIEYQSIIEHVKTKKHE